MPASYLVRVAVLSHCAQVCALCVCLWCRCGIADILSAFRRRLGLPLLSANNLGSALYR